MSIDLRREFRATRSALCRQDLMAQPTYTVSEFVPRARRTRSKARRRRRLKLLALILGAGGALATAGVVALMIGIRQSDACAASLAYVARHGLVKQELGEPVEGGLFATGMLRIDPAGGESRLRFEACGPRGCGDASVATRGVGGQCASWTPCSRSTARPTISVPVDASRLGVIADLLVQLWIARWRTACFGAASSSANRARNRGRCAARTWPFLGSHRRSFKQRISGRKERKRSHHVGQET
jgi:hypothetical protein